MTEFGVFVTSNASFTHILFGDSKFTPCGLENEAVSRYSKHPCSEVRSVYPAEEFKKYVETNRVMHSELRFCKRCLKAYDKWYNDQQKK